MNKVYQNSCKSTLPDNYVDTVREGIQSYFDAEHMESAGNCFLTFIIETPPEEYPDMSFASARQILRSGTGINLSDGDCLEVIGYFTSGLSRLLDVILTYVDEESGRPYRLNSEQALLVLREGKFYHPIAHDQLVEDIDDHLLISYKASNLGKQIHSCYNS